MIDLLNEHSLQTAGVMAVGTALYALYSNSKDKETGGFDKIPMPKGKYPYVGHLPYLIKNSFLKIYEWHKELGPIVHVKMGVQDFIFISDPTIAHEIFNVNGGITTLRPPNKFGDGAYSMNGSMNAMLQVEIDHLIDQLMKHGKSSEGVYPLMAATFMSLNVMKKVCFGTCFSSTEDVDFMKLLSIIPTVMLYAGIDDNIDTYVPALSFMSYLQNKEKKRQDFLNNSRNPVFRSMIAQALEIGEDCIVKRMNSNESDLLIGGSDTISVTILWFLAFLSHHPEVQKKICGEIDSFITKYKRLPMFSEREEFPYMISVQREILRLYPTTPYGSPHVAEQDFVFSNYLINKGAYLVSDMYSMHRNPNVYHDPEEFIPERFINNTSTFHASANGKPTERDQYNFGWGRRICPGIYLAETELFLTNVGLWARCTVEPVIDSDGNPVYPDIKSFVDSGLVTIPKPYKVRFVERPDRLL
ncbi:cytochrome P450 [Spinellus fusiger]|nr:cytochrome P450 [Spinellus fusiger]